MGKGSEKRNRNPKAIAAYLTKAMEHPDNHTAFPRALLDIIRDYGVTAFAEQTGIRRETLHRALGQKNGPTFAMVVRSLAALGVKVKVVPKITRHRVTQRADLAGT